MAAALGNAGQAGQAPDEDLVEQVLMKNPDRSRALPSSFLLASRPPSPVAAPPLTKWQRLGRNNLPSSSPANQPLRLASSGPQAFTLPGLGAVPWQAGQERGRGRRRPQAQLRLGLLWSPCAPFSSSLDAAPEFACKKVQIFEKKGVSLGVVVVSVRSGGQKGEARNRAAIDRGSGSAANIVGVKLPFGLCGCQDENSRNVEEDGGFDGDQIQLPCPLPESSIVVGVDEWGAVRSCGDEVSRWMISSEEIEFVDQVGLTSFKGVYRGKKVWIKKLRGCEKGSAYEFEIRQDLLQLMTCGHRNIVQFVGICIEECNGLCVVMRMMEGGSVHDLIQRSKKIGVREVIRIAVDLAEGLMFMNSHGAAYRDLNGQRILLDRQGNAFLGDMGIVTSCNNVGEVTEYETAGYRWLAPEIIAGDPETVTETWMSNVYSFGMVIWEMVTGEAAYSSYSPVQAAVGIAACGLRPEIPRDCPQVLRSLMMKCWNNCPSKRPQFSEIIAILQKQSNR
ncbi:serine/threonine-protein kinase STY17 [Asparagus officinalis]|uniref:serine/threonine-protein kinase STY17 n=1 Tax=Asparagus officinalis TaxID=4686 RepID=UPI00098E1B74|nr:serine/threonine-protein kinase STY17 [Asparagus officinalis]